MNAIKTGWLACLLAVSLVGAAEPKVDPQAQKVLEQVATHVRSLEGVQVNVTLTQRIAAGEFKKESVLKYALTGQRPNQLRLAVEGAMALTVACDGQKMFTVLPSMQKYTADDAPADWGAVLADNGVGTMVGGPGYQALRDWLGGDAVKKIMAGVTNLKYVGAEQLDGVKCHRLRFVQAEGASDAWIADGPQPWLRQIEFDMTEKVKQFRAQQPELKDVQASLVIVFNDWVANPAWKEDAFRFQAPAGVELVETFFKEEPSPEHSKLLGQAAPAFKLAALAGGDVELASHKDKNIVVLDFWATWCGPCRRGLPILQEVTEAYRAKGVVFYAVNQEEPAGTVREFLEKSGLKLPVLLDADAKVGALYSVQGIPQTVIIGKDGTVQAVHVGVAPDLKKRLRQELESLVAGKVLVPAQPAGKAD